MARRVTLPEGYFHCQWCNGGVRYVDGNRWPARCPHCHLHPHPSKVDETVNGNVNPDKAKASRRNRQGAAREKEFNLTPVGKPVLGVDPGAKYTGICLRDGDWLGYSATLICPEGMDCVDWMHQCVAEIKFILLQHCPVDTKVAVEGVSAPRGFKNGKAAPINPKYILFAGVVLGGVAAAFSALVIPPGGNGSQHITHYHPDLVGRRPASLPGSTNGAGTRDHEQSAWDVAGKAVPTLWPRVTPDLRRLVR